MIESLNGIVHALWPAVALTALLLAYSMWCEREAWKRLPQIATSVVALGVHLVGAGICAWLLYKRRLGQTADAINNMDIFLLALGLLIGTGYWIGMFMDRRGLTPLRRG